MASLTVRILAYIKGIIFNFGYSQRNGNGLKQAVDYQRTPFVGKNK